MSWIKKVFNFRKCFFIRVVDVVRKNNNVYFLVKDLLQLKLYRLSSDEISNKKVLKNIDPVDSYFVGQITCEQALRRCQFSQVSFLEKNIILRSKNNDEIIGDLWEILADPGVIEHCDIRVLQELIRYSYRLGKNVGMEEENKVNNYSIPKQEGSEEVCKKVIYLAARKK